MLVTDLTRPQLTELKGNYLVMLASEGKFAEVVGVDYDAPSYHDIANADAIVPDDVIFNEYEGVEFVEEDFSKEDDRGEMPWDYGKHFD